MEAHPIMLNVYNVDGNHDIHLAMITTLEHLTTILGLTESAQRVRENSVERNGITQLFFNGMPPRGFTNHVIVSTSVVYTDERGFHIRDGKN